jgi:hypothetical protein
MWFHSWCACGSNAMHLHFHDFRDDCRQSMTCWIGLKSVCTQVRIPQSSNEESQRELLLPQWLLPIRRSWTYQLVIRLVVGQLAIKSCPFSSKLFLRQSSFVHTFPSILHSITHDFGWQLPAPRSYCDRIT